MNDLLLAECFPAGARPFNPAGHPPELVVVLALGATEIEDGAVLFNEHLARSRLDLAAAETADVLFDHCPSPPREFLGLTLGFDEHKDISFPDRPHGVAGDDPAFVVTVEDPALDLHRLSVHAG